MCFTELFLEPIFSGSSTEQNGVWLFLLFCITYHEYIKSERGKWRGKKKVTKKKKRSSFLFYFFFFFQRKDPLVTCLVNFKHWLNLTLLLLILSVWIFKICFHPYLVICLLSCSLLEVFIDWYFFCFVFFY